MPDTTLGASTLPSFAWHDVTRRLGYEDLFRQFSKEAAKRDVSRQAIHAETAALKARGFGALRLPQAQGGQAITLPELFFLIRDLARADPNIAHVFRNHFFAVEQALQEPGLPFSKHLLQLVASGRTLGVAFSEQTGEPAGAVGLTPQVVLTWSEPDQGWHVSGKKIYSTGNLYADDLLVTALDPGTGSTRQFLVAATTAGISLDDDWDGFGQKLTGSGSTLFDKVLVNAPSLFDVPARATDGPNVLYGFTFHQVYLTTAIAGIAARILEDAVALVRQRTRNYYHGLSARPADEPELQSAIGRISAHRSAIASLTERAALALEHAWQVRNVATEAHTAALAATLSASEAKVVADETAATLASLLIDVASGSGVGTQAALDRHWRNIKVISSHNPRLYKERVLGSYFLNGTLPPTGAFF